MQLRQSVLLRYFLISFTLLLIFGLSGAFASYLVLTTFGQQMGDRPPQFISHFVNGFIQEGMAPAKVVDILNQSNHQLLPLDYYYYDPHFQQQAAPEPNLLAGVSLQPYLSAATAQKLTLEDLPKAGDHLMITRLEHGGYLVMHLVKARSFLSQGAYLPALGAFVFFLLLGFSLAFGYVVLRLRERFAIARQVLDALKGGELQARFPVTRMDEFGRGMTLFNQMADEIETHVNKLRQQEAQTRSFFIGVAHDLRTPLASQQNMLELLVERKQALSDEQYQRMLRLSLLETRYFARLVEDMLFLSKLELLPERTTEVALDKLIRQVAEGFTPQLQLGLTLQPAHLKGDPLLLMRLVRNLLDNASRFAQAAVHLSLQRQAKTLCLRCEDDGPGFDAEALHSYGKQRHQRTMQGEHLALGLGSVIVAEITRLHQGQWRVYNQGERLSGAVVEVLLPIQ